MSVIPILCPECGMATLTPRQPHDHPEAVRLEVLCGECARGDFAEECYYDRDGKHITRDPAVLVELPQSEAK